MVETERGLFEASPRNVMSVVQRHGTVGLSNVDPKVRSRQWPADRDSPLSHHESSDAACRFGSGAPVRDFRIQPFSRDLVPVAG